MGLYLTQMRFYPYTIVFLVSCIIDLLALALVVSKSRFPGKAWLILELAAIFVWNFFTMLAYSTCQFTDRLIWSKLAYLGINTVAPLLLIFLLNYPIARFKVSKKLIALLFVIPIFTILTVFTNDLHHLYWTDFTLISSETNVYLFHHGVFYWIALSYNYLCGLACIFLMISIMRDYQGLYHSQAFILLVSSVFPFLAGLLYSFETTPYPGLDFLPLAYTISGLGLVICVVFFRMLDIVPIGRNLMVEKMEMGLIVIDDRNHIVDINPAAQKLLLPRVIKIGDMIQKAGDEISFNVINSVPEAEVEIEAEQTKVLDLATTILKNHSGTIIGKMGILRDVTENHQLRKQLQEMATHDALTGLPNRRLFSDRLSYAIADAKRGKRKFAVLSLDLDRFKEINDIYGHAVGDQVLIEIGVRISRSLREVDTVARLGGDEFVVLLVDTHTTKGATVAAQKILSELRRPFIFGEHEVLISASLGIAIYPNDSRELEELMHKSDQAMYLAKSSGKDTFRFYTGN